MGNDSLPGRPGQESRAGQSALSSSTARISRPRGRLPAAEFIDIPGRGMASLAAEITLEHNTTVF
jgi:hypothetical protein